MCACQQCVRVRNVCVSNMGVSAIRACQQCGRWGCVSNVCVSAMCAVGVMLQGEWDGQVLRVGLARTIHIRYFWQGVHQIYGHVRCVYIYSFGQPLVQ